MKTNGINFKHLYYFWITAQEGSLTRAAERLNLSIQTISEQVRLLENSLGRTLLRQQGRRLILTEAGHIAQSYADQIFRLGTQLQEAMQDGELDETLRVLVGISDAIPKLFAYRLIKGAMSLPRPVRITCLEGDFENLLADLVMHKLDVLLTDRPSGHQRNLRVYSHLIGEWSVGIFGRSDLHARYQKDFPSSLNGAPILLPAKTNALRTRLDHWFFDQNIRPKIIGEFEDSALLYTVGKSGHGLFPAPLGLAADIEEQFSGMFVGEIEQVREQFFAISNEQRIVHPGVDAVISAWQQKA